MEMKKVILIILSLAILLGVVFCFLPKETRKQLTMMVTNGFDDREVAVAERNVRRLFSSAQNTFAHRHGRMAVSIDELGVGFGIGNHGTIIYEDIWSARVGARSSDSKVAEAMARRPYRYAVIAVTGLTDEASDKLTSCIVAMPTENRQEYPVLVMIAGPVRDDGRDFLRPWPIMRIYESSLRTAVQELVSSKKAIDKSLVERLKGVGGQS